MNRDYDRRGLVALLGGLALGAAGSPARSTEAATTGIDKSLFVPIGGIDQWIWIKGEDVRNPVLLVVHGGPGEAQWPVAAHYEPWEKAFTVVLWDQRGAGHTFGRYGKQTPEMTLDRFANDGNEVADYLCRTLGKRRIIVLGHSWGSLVAVTMVQRRPELYAAYVGTGQATSWKTLVNSQFDLLLAKARVDGDTATVQQLEAIGRPDYTNTHQYFTFSKNLLAAMAPPDRDWIKGLRAGSAAQRAADPKNFQDFEDGFGFTAEKVLPDQVASDLPATASKIDTAFFVIQGRDDIIASTPAAVDYFNQVKAPRKELVLIPGAGHFAYLTSPGPFLTALTDKVRPVAIARGA